VAVLGPNANLSKEVWPVVAVVVVAMVVVVVVVVS